MNKKIFTQLQIREMTIPQYRTFSVCMQVKAFGLMGMPWKTKISWYQDLKTGNLVFLYD